jgi:molecular chaperone GrpE (heat shock protein)
MSDKPREFDIYGTPERGSFDEVHVCENYVPWTNGCHWGEPDFHVIEKSAFDKAQQKIKELEKERDEYKCQLINERDDYMNEHKERIEAESQLTRAQSLLDVARKALEYAQHLDRTHPETSYEAECARQSREALAKIGQTK